MGCRSLPATQRDWAGSLADNAPAVGPVDQNAKVAEYFGVMLAQDPRVDKLDVAPGKMFRAFSFERRDIVPIIETEAFARRRCGHIGTITRPPALALEGAETTRGI